MNYKGYGAIVEYDDAAGIFHGQVANVRNVITFQAASVEELRQAFQDSVEDYLEFCQETTMPHPLVDQLRFARSEFVRCLDGVSEEDGVKRLQPMNCISWIVGHLANQEHAYWVFLAQGKVIAPDLRKLVGFGQPASTPPLAEMWATWRDVTAAADGYLDTLTSDMLLTRFLWKGSPMDETVGTLLQRNLYHYWFHAGEAHAIRQVLGHPDLPQFVGEFGEAAVYRPA